MNLKHIVNEADTNKTVKQILKSRLGISERLLKKLKYNNRIYLNSMPVYVNAIALAGDIIEAFIDFDEEESDTEPENIPIDIIYEDECMIVLNKQAGIVVHPTFNHPSGTIANAVAFHMLKSGIVKKIRPVSRLDRDTTGIIIFAKNEYVQESLIRQMNEKTLIKEYMGVVSGIVSEKTGKIVLPISRKPDSIMLRHVSEDGDHSVTHFECLEQLNNATLLRFILETGRTHQIRVHCQAIGHPLVGDTLYSDIISENISRQALHSHRIQLRHPFSGEIMEFTAPLPNDIMKLLEILRK
ncbi:MAG TPA: RluA family pseudouridine synthase [Clostridia bacterium]|nr:RluA family pseudouridine synthase [Clostridia bacterium]